MTNIPSPSYVHGGSDQPLLGETIGACLDRIAKKFGDREALVVRHQNIRWTYAQLLKLTNNMVLACAIEVMGEAFSLIEKSGADPEALRDVLTEGVFSSPAYIGYSRAILDRSWDAVGFTATLALKDVDLALATGAANGVPLPSAEVCRERLLRAIAGHQSDLSTPSSWRTRTP